eukprot:725405_1
MFKINNKIRSIVYRYNKNTKFRNGFLGLIIGAIVIYGLSVYIYSSPLAVCPTDFEQTRNYKNIIRNRKIKSDEQKLVNSFISGNYWEKRYKKGGNSGQGSYGPSAMFKASVINAFVKRYKITGNVVELGCGDGNNLLYYNFDKQTTYIGYDVSQTIIEKNKK